MPFQFPEPSTLYRPVWRVRWDNGNNASKKVVVIGINPGSTGRPETPDKEPKIGPYLRNLTALLDSTGHGEYNDFTLINLFSHVSKDPAKIDFKSATDFRQYRNLFERADMILIAWGVQDSEYAGQKRAALEVLKNYEAKVYCMERQGKGPIHPSDRRGLADAEIVKVNIFPVYAMSLDLNQKLP